jgi:hypothetical protein
MSEQSHGYNPSVVGDIAQLPQDFLGVDPQLVAVSASQVRTMADLRQGLDHLNDNLVLATMASYTRTGEQPDSLRHVNRGMALTQLLLEESSPGFLTQADGYFNDTFKLEPANGASELYRRACDQLTEARRCAVLSEVWQLTPEEAAHNENTYQDQVDEVLNRAGLSGYFESAVSGLNGAGLEEPTSLPDAKFGAARFALVVGALNNR